MTNVAWLALL